MHCSMLGIVSSISLLISLGATRQKAAFERNILRPFSPAKEITRQSSVNGAKRPLLNEIATVGVESNRATARFSRSHLANTVRASLAEIGSIDFAR